MPVGDFEAVLGQPLQSLGVDAVFKGVNAGHEAFQKVSLGLMGATAWMITGPLSIASSTKWTVAPVKRTP